jgi:LmbE family N-acetylglucosaminyl deacetylase
MKPDFNSPQNNSDLLYRLRGLGMSGAILHVGAHPDDEDVGSIAYMARKFGARTVYWSATRGEGGQNRIGPYKGESLGVYRTWETLSVRAVDGGEALFGPFIDYGFSKNGEDCLNKWNRTCVVKEIVRAIRMIQPQILISRFTGRASDGHGQHQAIGIAALEAFEAAGDASAFPELLEMGLAPWQPRKFYQSTVSGMWVPGDAVYSRVPNPESEREGFVRINSGEFDPIAGRSYQEQAWMGFNRHQTQAMGVLPARGDYFYYFSLYKSLVPVPDRESGLYDGLDPALTGLADYPGNGSPSFRTALENIGQRVDSARKRYRIDDPMAAAPALMEGLSLLRELQADMANEKESGLSEPWTKLALGNYLSRKLNDFEEVSAQCLGLNLESLADHARISPGKKLQVESKLWNPGNVPVKDVSISLRLPEGWENTIVEQNLEATEVTSIFDVAASKDAALTCPYWLANPHGVYQYNWSEFKATGQPFESPLVEARCTFKIDQNRFNLVSPTIFRECFAGGFREFPLKVIPPISLHPAITKRYLQVSASAQQLELMVVAVSNAKDRPVQGELMLKVPEGWQAAPPQVHLSLEKGGDARTITFTVTVPENIRADNYILRFVIVVEGREYDVVLNPIRMVAPGIPGVPQESNCIKEDFVTRPAAVDVRLFDVKFVENQRYAYVEGATDEILNSLSGFDLDFHVISDKEMGYIDLKPFDAVIIGPNAYIVRDELKKNSDRFLEYAKQGGTIVLQHQGYPYQEEGLAPYPLKYVHPMDRVTDENAPVTILKPEHSIFNFPNTIGEADYEGWIKDRGMYFFHEWDNRYEPLLECHDQGGALQKGGMLVAGVGRGTYLYTGYTFFNQLPAGVAGGFRLMANILGLPEARIIERIKFLKNISLFSDMEREHLDAVARIIYEEWIEDGRYICREGEAGNELYIIKSGHVEVLQKEGNDVKVVFTADVGACIGELAVLSNIPRTASLRARGNTQLLLISADHFLPLLKHHPDISLQMLKLLVERVLILQKSSKK